MEHSDIKHGIKDASVLVGQAILVLRRKAGDGDSGWNWLYHYADKLQRLLPDIEQGEMIAAAWAERKGKV